MQSRSPARGFGLVCRFLAALAAATVAYSFAASNVVEYTYDAAGNIVQIARQPSPGFAITSFDPTSGAVGATVTIYGTGFSATPANNTVKFNGVTATVSASDAGSISTTVPGSATTGRITVTVGGNTASSATDFVVTVPGAPTIASFTPGSGAAGTSVSVTGTNFDPTAGATTVKLNGVTATATVSTTTSLSFSVPGATASGRITATTSGGTGMSASDFLVPPPGFNLSEIAATARISANGPAANLAIGTAGTRGLVLFDANVDTYYTVQFGQLAVTPSSANVAYSVIKPDNTVLTSGSISMSGGTNRPTILLPKLPATGTYSIVVSPGSATFNSNIKLVQDPVITIDGAVTNIALDTPGQWARMVFEAISGQRLGFGATGMTLSPDSTSGTTFKLYKPDGTYQSDVGYCYSASGGNTAANCDSEFQAAVTGTHTIVAQPVYLSAASFGALLSSEVTGSLTADSGADLTLSRVGQDGRFTFSATAGDSLGFALSALSIQPQVQSVYATIYKPDGTSLTNSTPSPPNGGYAELGTLATTGTYTVGIDPSLGAYGTMRLTLKQGPLLATTDSPAAFAPATVTEAARYRFAATAGQPVAFGITGMTNVVGSGSSTVNVYAPDRSIPVTTTCSPSVAGGTCKLTLVPAVTGTYALAIVPPQSTKISGNIVVSSDITGTLVNGTPQTITSTRSGQNARFTFSGTAGDSTLVKLYAITTTPASQTVTVRIYKPDGNALTSGSGSSSGAAAINLASLPTTGTYTVLVEPFYGTTWQGTLALDPGPLVTVDGATQALSSAAGEPVRVRFAGTAGQRMEWGISGLAYAVSNANATGITVYSPSGSTVTSQSCYTSGSGNCEFSSTSLPATGTYSVLLVPPSASAISAGTFAASTPLGGTFVISDPAQAVALTRPGQTARYTFSGTSGQLLRLNWSGATVSGGASVSISILKPDNSTLSSGSFANGASSGLDIASLPTTGTYTVVLDPSAAATMSASMSLVTR